MPEIPHKQTALVRAPKIDGGVLPGDGSTGDRSDICGTGRIDFRHHGMACAAQCLQGDYGPGDPVCFSGQAGQLKNILRLSGQDRPFIFWAACFISYHIGGWIFRAAGSGVYFKGRKPLPCPAGRQYSHGDSSFFFKIRRFHNKVYTQACLWE